MAASPQSPRPLNRLLDYFHIEDGELEPTLLLSLYLLLVMATIVCLKAVSDSVFLSTFDARRLPYVDLPVTVLVGIVVSLYLRLSSRLGLPNTIKLTQAFVALNLLAFWLLLRAQLPGTPVLIYLWVGIFAVLLPSQVWSLSGLVFDTRQAKRLFSLIGSGGILGAALGGNIAGFIGLALGTESVLLFTVAFGIACSAIVSRLSGLAKSAPLPSGAAGPAKRSILDSMRLVGGSRYLLLITLAIFFSTVPSTLIKYQFKAIAQLELASDRDALTSFYGYFSGYIAVFSFLFHTLLTERILRFIGLSSCLFILPMALLGGSTSLFFSTTLAAAIGARGSDQGFRHSIDRSSMELLYVPVPANIRSRVKSFMDVVVSRSADALASVVLLGLVSIGRTQVVDISWVNLLFIAPWLFLLWQLRKEYVRTLRSTIERKDIQAEELLRNLAESSPPAELETTLQGSDQRSLETAIDWMQYGGANAAHAHLASLLTHSSPAIRRKAMAVVANHHIAHCEREALSFLTIESGVEARWQALEYLRQQGGSGTVAVLEGLLEGDDRELAATVAARLLRDPDTRSARASEVLASYIEWAANAETPSRVSAARLIGLAPVSQQLHLQLSRALRDPAPDVQRAALESASAVRPREEISLLLERVCDPAFRREARDALVAFGSPILSELGQIVRNGSLNHQGRREVFRIIGLIGGQKAADLLVENVRTSGDTVLSEVLSALNRIRRRQADVQFDREIIMELLVDELRDLYQEAAFLAGIPAGDSGEGVVFLRRALRERLDRHRDEIFHLLALVYPHREILDARHWVFSGRPDLRSNALEFLDTRLSNPVRQMLLPALEERGARRMLEVGQELFGLDEIPYPSVLRRLLAWPDTWLQSCASYVAGEAKLVELRPILLPLATASDPILSETAARAGARLSAEADSPGAGARKN
jgi:AAA family ATP:ADP antiporter